MSGKPLIMGQFSRSVLLVATKKLILGVFQH